MKWFVSFVLVAGLLVGCDPPTIDDNSHAPKTPPSNVGSPEGKPFTVPGLEMEMLWCKPGTFTMGSPKSEKHRDEDETQHTVTLTQGYWLGKYEVTQSQWKAIMGARRQLILVGEEGANFPVTRIYWDRATSFCKKLTERERKAGRLPTGYAYQLPTEAQWEYACRAGTKTAYSFGDAITEKQANFHVGKIRGTIVVGTFPANPWGFHNMHGNVWEWCSDWYGKYPTGTLTGPTGPTSGSSRVIRGGSWHFTFHVLRSAERGIGGTPGYRSGGFRAALRFIGE
jgi:formylglycine-generating enzyme